MITKGKGGYSVKSHTTNRKFGTYKSKKAAKKRLAQIKYFSKKK